MRFHKSWMMAAMLGLLASASVAVAQDQQQRAPKPEIIEKVQIETAVAGGDADVITSVGGPNTFVFINSEMSFDRKTVKGAPYSAEATTETIQTLSDGNRIIRKNSATVYRDSDGRTRREQTLGAIGQWTAAGDPPKTIFINDPVARVSYTLDPKSQTARKLSLPQFVAGGNFARVVAPGAPGGPNSLPLPAPAPNGSVRVFDNAVPNPNGANIERQQPKVESLGKQMIEGVEAEGTRTTVTIPAGKIGNERQIDIVTERWYSPELQVVVYSKKSDPMTGETTYKLTNVNRNEPSRSLFEVPPGYTVKESRDFTFQLRDRNNKIIEERKAQQ